MEQCHSSNYHAVFFAPDHPRYYSQTVATTTHPRLQSATPLRLPDPLARKMQKPMKRKHEHATIESCYVESCLLQLCRAEQWTDVVRRCEDYPEEASLVPMNHRISWKSNEFQSRSRKRYLVKRFGGEDCQPTIFRKSALGIVCASKDMGTDEAQTAILALLNANPLQVGASQYVAGHTPLRDAILNDSCTLEIFGIMIRTMSRCMGGDISFHLRDINGLLPIDHLTASIQLGSTAHSIAMMEEFLRAKSKTARSIENSTSPLIRLLTTGNSSNTSLSGSGPPVRFSSRLSPEYKHNLLHSQRVLSAAILLLDDDPSLLHHFSHVTKCTPLHIALRNYGNYEPLIHELLERDQDSDMLRARNLYGDLPIHVACSVGVPFKVLCLIVERTASISSSESIVEQMSRQSFVKRDRFIWSTNQSGYTPIDLEWIRHNELGNDVYTARPFYPVEATGVRNHCFKEDEYYRGLLKESVAQMMENHDAACSRCQSELSSREAEAKATFGSLLDRISLLIRAAATSGPILDSKGMIRSRLIESCTLGTPYSPSLPLPILQLFLWLRPQEVLEKDRLNMLPIHHALRFSVTLSRNLSTQNAVDDWRSFVFQLLGKSADQCKAKCRDGRLPLHYVLDHSGEDDTNGGNAFPRAKLQSARHAIVEKLIELYPASVDQRDPISGLYPFMLASVDQNLSIDTVFYLLRHSPSRCPDLRTFTTKKN
ncbi:unnamed protein product [Pseudo-nitzschia multistriata]|uniref:Uncharacterized protein n=1 Tax=Pseudo-nitzschia multistriata TaxID=183589 RepID=A0A448ZHB0_9STRA|nr:unnamed protein product [Pseudo-nitzschia multistriata]